MFYFDKVRPLTKKEIDGFLDTAINHDGDLISKFDYKCIEATYTSLVAEIEKLKQELECEKGTNEGWVRRFSAKDKECDSLVAEIERLKKNKSGFN